MDRDAALLDFELARSEWESAFAKVPDDALLLSSTSGILPTAIARDLDDAGAARLLVKIQSMLSIRIFATMLEPPYEKNGKVMPVSVNRPITPPTMTTTWMPRVAATPVASSAVNRSSERNAAAMPRTTTARYKPSNAIAPSKPNSSAQLANT